MLAAFHCPPMVAATASHSLLLLVSCLFLAACSPSEPPPPPLFEIGFVDVVQRDQPISLDMVGETRGSSDIPIRARVEGVVLGMHFVEGRAVEKDQLLYSIDPEPFEAEVLDNEGALAEVRTHLVKAKADLDRVRPLAEMNAVSQSDLDGAVAQYDAASAAVQSARARVDLAKIRLGYTKIESPIAGRIGISEARVGEFVGVAPNPVVLNYVSQTDPIRVRFSVDERTYLSLARRLREFREEGGKEGGLGASLELTLADGTVHPYPGHTVAADAAVDPKTGTFTLEADFANPSAEAIVVAGQFARVRAISEVRKDALLVPSRSTSELQGSFRVYVIDDKDTVEMRPVELGPTIGNFRIVDSGLKAGERVAIEIMKLKPGMVVKPKRITVDENGTIVKSNPGQKSGSADAAASGSGKAS